MEKIYREDRSKSRTSGCKQSMPDVGKKRDRDSKEKVKGYENREIKSSLFILDLKGGKL